MKIIGLTYNYSTEKVVSFPGIYLMADSSLLKDNKPLFLPSFSKSFSARSAFIIRISRLGKNISKKFAHRYYDAVTIGLSVFADDLNHSLNDNHIPLAIASSFDHSAILGSFIPVEEIKEPLTDLSLSIIKNDEIVSNLFTNSMNFDFDSIIEYISQYYTLKIGDIIYTGFNDISFPIAINDNIVGMLNGDTILNFKIK